MGDCFTWRFRNRNGCLNQKYSVIAGFGMRVQAQDTVCPRQHFECRRWLQPTSSLFDGECAFRFTDASVVYSGPLL